MSVSWCVAVGSGGTSEGGLYVEVWNGSTWAPTTSPTPSGDEGLTVGAVSCTTPGYCMAVGNMFNGTTDGAWSSLWNGTSWTTEAMPSATDKTTMNAVSCVGIAGFCTAVGYTEMTGPPTYENAILNWNGSTWALEPPVPSTPPAFGQFLIGVSCFSATSCTAVGGVWTDSGGSTQVTEAFTWNGQSWSAAASPNATGAVETSFTGVDCVTNWACVAVGTSQELTSTANEQPFNAMAPIARSGYRFVASDGGIFNYGAGAPFLGSMGGQHLNAPIVGMATMPAGDGYYLAASDGGVFNFGSAQFFGSAGSLHLNAPIVGIAVTPDGGGYWLVASDGGIFSYGDAQFYGSMGGKPLNKPIVGIASLPNGDGYYLVASDGGLFTFPTGPQGPPFLGSPGSITLNKPIVGMAVTPSASTTSSPPTAGLFSFPRHSERPPLRPDRLDRAQQAGDRDDRDRRGRGLLPRRGRRRHLQLPDRRHGPAVLRLTRRPAAQRTDRGHRGVAPPEPGGGRGGRPPRFAQRAGARFAHRVRRGKPIHVHPAAQHAEAGCAARTTS